MSPTKTANSDTKKVFWHKGTCSRTFFFLLNREFDHLKDIEERAADALAGGVLRKGFQCGMIWGAALGAGAEAYRKSENLDRAIDLAMNTTQQLVASFANRTHTVNCRDITETDFSKKLQMANYLLFKAKSCFDLAADWAPEAIDAAHIGLSMKPPRSHKPLSCASEVVRKMGANAERQAMVAGFAGGLGLSGYTCGALSAAIWMSSIDWCQQHPRKMADTNPMAKKTYQRFQAVTDSNVLCHKICGRRFKSIDDHAEYIDQGGCAELIDALAKAT